MIITHASQEKIESVTSTHDCNVYKGCLFFAAEGSTYNMISECNYQYNLDVENIIEVSQIFYRHSHDEDIIAQVLNKMRDDLLLDDDMSLEELADILDETTDCFKLFGGEEAGEKSWIIQQYQGILAHKLGYDCAESEDEQGTVYIAYCVDRELQELIC